MELADGRTLAFTEWGVPDGPVVLAIHGTPLSRLLCPDPVATQTSGVRLVMPDRPGYGGSEAPAIPSLRAWTDDLSQLVDALGVDEFRVVGISAGGMYSAAAAAVLGDRLAGAGSVCGAWWPVDEQPGALELLGDVDRQIHLVARSDPEAGRALAAELDADWVDSIREDPAAMAANAFSTPSDLRYLEDPEFAAAFYAAEREAVRQGAWGIAWGTAASLAPWGFALEDIGIEFHLWHGGKDPIERIEDLGFWAERIPRTRVRTWEESGHLVVVEHWGEILADLLS